MNESHINRINELLGESVIYESAKKKTKIKLSLDDGSKKEMDFDGSLNDAKKKYSGKKVKTIRKSKSGDIIGEAVIVSVEELNESKELIPFGYFKITYSDGSSKKTQARAKTAEDFKKYLTQNGDTIVTDEDEDGKETKKKIVKVEKLDEAANSGKKLIKIAYEIWDEDSLEAGETDDKGWEDEEGEEFESDEDRTAAEKAIKFLKKKFATQASSNSYDSRVWYQDDGDTDMKTGDKKYLTYHLHGSWTPEEKKEIYKGVTNKKINESEETKFKVNKDLIVSESLPQYFETMLWSTTDMDTEEPLDKEYTVKDISKELKDSSKKDLLSFAEYCEKNCSKELEEYLEEEGYESFGHDFWLSRNGHGAGFFDRGNGYKALQKASKTFGEVDPMADKGKIIA